MPPKKRRVDDGFGGSHTQADDGGVEIRAQVTEIGDTISCSIEETNRIRIQLGLRPLDVGPSKASRANSEAVDNFQREQEKNKAAQETSALSERLLKAKENRQEKAKHSQRTLGDVSGAEEKSLLSAADWVKRSREVEIISNERKKNEAAAAAKRLEEDEQEAVASGPSYSADDLNGLGVRHSREQFTEGEDVILTLADEQVLSKDERGHAIGINDGEDALENVQFAEAERLRDTHKRIRKSKLPAYSGFDDDEFDGNNIEGEAPPKRKILAQYDDAPAKATTKLVLGTHNVAAAGVKLESELNPDSTNSSSGSVRAPVSLQVHSKGVASDFYTTAEFASFTKNREKTKKLRKKRKIRVKEEGEHGEGDEVLASNGGNGESVGQRTECNAMDIEGATKEFRMRTSGTPAGTAAAVSLEEKERRQAYERAVLAATGKVTIGHGPNFDQSMQRASIAHANGGDDQGAIWAQKMVSRIIKREPEESDKTDKITFTNTTEFSSIMHAHAIGAAPEGDLNATSIKMEEDLGQVSQLDSKASAQSASASDSATVRSSADGATAWSSHEPVAARGMAATLSLLQSSGELAETRREKLAGRAKDSRVADPSSSYGGEFDVKLDYRDEFGRKMTQKQAFRQMNYAFHGIGPSKNSQEKRMRAMDKDRQKANIDRSLESASMKGLLNMQQMTGSAHMVISSTLGGNEGGSGAMRDSEAVSRIAREQVEKMAARRKQKEVRIKEETM